MSGRQVGDIAEWGEDAGPSRFYRQGHQLPCRNSSGSVEKPVLGVGAHRSGKDARSSAAQMDIIGAARPSISDRSPQKIKEAGSTISAPASAAMSASLAGQSRPR